MANAGKRRPKAVKGHILPKPVPYGFEVTDTTKHTWKIGNSIGQGGFGVVYEASDGKSKDFNFVIKVEHHGNGPLFTEMHCYHYVGKPEKITEWTKKMRLPFLGISPCFGSGSYDLNGEKYRFMVLERFGKDLQHFLNKNGNILHPKTVFTVGIIVLNALEYIHSQEYVHNDIKAGNLLCGYTKNKENNVYLLDLGLAGRYVTKEGVHKKNEPDPRRQHNGTIEFTSRDAHNGVYSRRSDLEVLGYNLLLWLSGKLPWQNVSDPAKVQKEKCRYMDDAPLLMQTLFKSKQYPEVSEYLQYVAQLEFEQEPDYDLCRKFMLLALKKSGHRQDGILIFDVVKSDNYTYTVEQNTDEASLPICSPLSLISTSTCSHSSSAVKKPKKKSIGQADHTSKLAANKLQSNGGYISEGSLPTCSPLSTTSTSTCSLSSSSIEMPKRKSIDQAGHALKFVANKLQSNDEEYSAFGKHVSERLRCLPANMAIYCQKIINDALFEAQVGTLSRYSKIITVREKQVLYRVDETFSSTSDVF